MKRLTVISIFFISLISCYETSRQASANEANDNLPIQVVTEKNKPKVDVFISLKDSIIESKDQIFILIRLTNSDSSNQKVLFDKPKVSTGGPWGASASVRNVRTNESVLELENKAMLSSKIYFTEELKDFYYILKPGQSIDKEYLLTNLVVFKITRTNYLLGFMKFRCFIFRILLIK